MTQWFQDYKNNINVLNTKPIERDHIIAQDPIAIEKWFKEYYKVKAAFKIRSCHIQNQDETGFRVGMPSGEEVVVPAWVKEVSGL